MKLLSSLLYKLIKFIWLIITSAFVSSTGPTGQNSKLEAWQTYPIFNKTQNLRNLKFSSFLTISKLGPESDYHHHHSVSLHCLLTSSRHSQDQKCQSCLFRCLLCSFVWNKQPIILLKNLAVTSFQRFSLVQSQSQITVSHTCDIYQQQQFM